jgi:catechol 2,3-dioxygenase-like lactoylglutathione lyase family enzyme
VLTGIDHLVVVTRELGAAIADYRALGFTVAPGGRHLTGTENALIALQDGAYIELIAFLDPDRPQPHRWWEPFRRGGGLIDFCAGTDAFLADVHALRDAGVALGPPQTQGRTRPDGYVLRWSLAAPAERQRGLAPFLIADETPRTERVPAVTSHPNGVMALETLTIAVADPTTVADWYRRFLGEAGKAGRRDDLGSATQRFKIGRHVIELATPLTRSSPLATFLEERGSGPWAATLTTQGREGPFELGRRPVDPRPPA